MASVLTATTETMTWLLARIAAVSLGVAWIGIMNIGFYPARKAASLNPIDALGYE